MKKLVIIGANDFQNKLILRAKELYYETHVFAWREGSLGEKTADYFYPISIVEKENILEQCKKIQPCAVISIASDLAMVTVNFVANALNLPCNSVECLKLTTNKFYMREQLKKSGVYTPNFFKVSQSNYLRQLDEIKDLFFEEQNSGKSAIVKPTDRSGSRGITKINGAFGIEKALLNAFSDSFEKSAIIEEYLDGDEYSCECISYNGEHEFLALTKKMTTGAPHFIETGHIQPSGLGKDIIDKIIPEIFKALTALEIKNGASHSEFKLDKDGKVKIIEIGARMGGDCIGSDLVALSTGYDFLKMVIDTARGIRPSFEKIREPKTAEVRFIFNQKDFSKLYEIEKTHPEKIYYKSKIEDVDNRKIVDSSTRFGYYILAY